MKIEAQVYIKWLYLLQLNRIKLDQEVVTWAIRKKYCQIKTHMLEISRYTYNNI